MSDQPAAVKPTRATGSHSGEFDYRSSREVALAFLEKIFQGLIVLNTAYLHLYPIPPECPCEHVPPGKGPGHLTEMAGQGDRMAFIGLLLRSADHIRELANSVSGPPEFKVKAEELKHSRPELAHGVAILKFLAAGLCRNDRQTPIGLLQLVQALKSNESCRLRHPLAGPIKLTEVYNKMTSNRSLTLISVLLDQCKACADDERVKKLRDKLGADLDPSKWHGCGDCELILLDILMYARMLPRTNHRMLASLRLSFDYTIDLRQVGDHNMVDQLGKGLREISSHLFKLGLTKVSWKESVSPDGCIHTKTMGCEVMFISGWQEGEEKKDNVRFLHDVLQEKQRRRLFFIQCAHQPQYQQRVQGNRQSRCCEPQIQMCLDRVAVQLGNAQQNLLELVPVALPMMSVHMVLEQDPCYTCKNRVMPEILTQVDQLKFPNNLPQLFTMLPYIPNSDLTFLERLTQLTRDQGPVRLKDDLKSFEKRHMCMAAVRGRCRNVRCDDGHCQYSKPYKVLAVIKLRCHELKWYVCTSTMPFSLWWRCRYDYTVNIA